MLLWYSFGVTAGGVPFAGLNPIWQSWGPLSPTSTAAPQPEIIDRGGGRYGFALDDAFDAHDGWIDLGATPGLDGRYVFYIAADGPQTFSETPSPQGVVFTVG